jgi:hypothetical protein
MIASVQTFPLVDPAFFNFAEPPMFDGLAYDALVTFDHTGAVDGLLLVPDLALALPAPTDGGRTYTLPPRPAPTRSSALRSAAEKACAGWRGCMGPRVLARDA